MPLTYAERKAAEKAKKAPPPYKKPGPKPKVTKELVKLADIAPVGKRRSSAKKLGSGKAAMTGDEIAILERDLVIIRLRKQGKSILEISEQVHCADRTVRERLKVIYENLKSNILEEAPEARTLERLRLDDLYAKARERVDKKQIITDPETGKQLVVEETDAKAIETCVKVSESIRKLEGLDAASKFEVNHSGGIVREYQGVSPDDL